MKTPRTTSAKKNRQNSRLDPSSSEEQLNRRIQTLMLDDEWNSTWYESPEIDGRIFRTVDDD